ncbi:hypothetical protein PLIIFM63780_000837 [Purpureocillium lilacinum]|nr:hypothetical protein PLIIFM63780_000837 [Purpureocillium lilacinum]
MAINKTVLQIAAFNDWEPFVLDDIIGAQSGDHGNLCKGQHSAFGISLLDPAFGSPGFKSGWCTAHVSQYQKNEYGVGERYAFDVIIYDAGGAQIGHAQKAAVDSTGHLSLTSKLPYTLDITVDDVDSSPVQFAYAGQLWTCDGKDASAHKCTLGNGPRNGYDNGNREGDMGFTCAEAPVAPPPITTSLRGMFVGDSITQGADGDYTWRYRLWQWLRNEGVDTNFVGPYQGTYPAASPADAKPKPPPLQGAGSPPGVVLNSGRYAADVEAAFPRPHYGMWGRQAAQVYPAIGAYVKQYQPDFLFILLGFNDLGWFVSGPEGTLSSVEKVVRNAQAARPSLKVLVGNVPQRTLIKVVNEQLPDKTTDYNKRLQSAVSGWSTDASTVRLVDMQKNYNCHPEGCPDGYDGLHPSALGEFHIAQSFADVLRKEFGVGKNPFTVGKVPARVATTPTNLQAASVPAGIEVTWDPIFGARGFDLQSRRKGSSDWTDRHALTNAYWETWVSDGDTVEYRVRTSMGDDSKSPWTGAVSATAHPKTAPGPKNIHGTSTGSGITATWDPVPGYSVNVYEFIVFDKDQPGAILTSVSTKSTGATINNLAKGHKHVISVVTWTDAGGGFPSVGPDVTV